MSYGLGLVLAFFTFDELFLLLLDYPFLFVEVGFGNNTHPNIKKTGFAFHDLHDRLHMLTAFAKEERTDGISDHGEHIIPNIKIYYHLGKNKYWESLGR